MPIRRPAPGTTKWWVVAAIGITLGCAMAGWYGWAGTRGPSWDTLGYHVIDDRNVDVTYQVSRRPVGRDVTCMIRAMDRGFGTVGQVEVHIPGSDTASVKRTTRLRTTTRAVTGVVRSCSVS